MTDSSSSFAFQPVVVLGAPRSGTNLLRDGLCAQAGIASWPCDEVNLLWRTGNASHPNDALVAAHARPEVRRRIRRSFSMIADRYQARWVVEKTCANMLRVPFVQRVVPEAKWVLITRDGYDVVASAMKRWTSSVDWRYTLRKLRYCPLADAPRYAAAYFKNRIEQSRRADRRVSSWGPRFEGIDEAVASRSLAEVCALQWRACVDAAEAGLAVVDPERVLRVRYEDLVADPGGLLTQTCDFLSAPTSPERIDAFARGVFRTSVGAGKRRLSDEELRAVQGVIESPTIDAQDAA